MGIFKRLFGGMRSRRKVRICVVGLDHSGKTTVLQAMKPKKASLETVPTVGFSTEEFQKHGIQFTAFDMSGQSRYRNLWEHYYEDVEGILVVIDATDKLRFAVVKDELEAMLADPKVAEKTPKIPILFLCNKMDLATASSPEEVRGLLDLATCCADRQWHIAGCDALRGEGLEGAMNWLANAMTHPDAREPSARALAMTRPPGV